MASKFKREFKNVVYNYSDAEAKVREATSNDPWGPSSAHMSQLADYTFHVEAYGLVMGMLWKRLNDHGKNWRHVYKALVVLEYLIKSGSERVAQQCKENMFSIQTLKDFQYVDKDGKDQGTNIREKAKNLVSLLKDDARLKDERDRATQARERQGGIGSDGTVTGTPKGTPKSNKKVTVNVPDGHVDPDGLQPGQSYIQPVEQARPGDTGEEDMQLKLAIQLSKQQAEDEKRLQQQEEESLKAALELSKVDCPNDGEEEAASAAAAEPEQKTSSGGDLLLDFSTTGLADPWKTEPAEPPPSYDMITGSITAPSAPPDPWGGSTTTTTTTTSASESLFDPWGGAGGSTGSGVPSNPSSSNQSSDFWSGNASSSLGVGVATSGAPPTANKQPSPSASFNPFDLSTLDPALPALASIPFPLPESTPATTETKRVEDEFLGELAQLVNLDTLTNPNVQQQPKSSFGPSPANPFGNPTGVTLKSNPFEANKPQAPTLNQLATTTSSGFTTQQMAAPLVPLSGSSPGGSPFGGSPQMPRRQQPQQQQPTTNGNASYNPFS